MLLLYLSSPEVPVADREAFFLRLLLRGRKEKRAPKTLFHFRLDRLLVMLMGLLPTRIAGQPRLSHTKSGRVVHIFCS